MNELFPKISDKLEPRPKALGWFYWLIYFPILPLLLITMFLGFTLLFPWIVLLVYFVINLIFVLCTFGRALLEDWTYFRVYFRDNIKKMFIGLILIVVFIVICYPIGNIFSKSGPLYNDYTIIPIADTLMGTAPRYLFLEQPLAMGIGIVLICPVTMGCMYNIVGFGTFAHNRPWLGYLAVTILAGLHYIVSVFFNEINPDITWCLIQFSGILLFHFIACWVYQQCDNIWPSIFLHMIVNLAGVTVYILPFL